MSQKIHPAKIGTFVLVALALGLGTLAVVSSGRLFKKTVPFVIYFDGDCSGLKPGAPVLYRGVTVGQVTQIQLVFDEEHPDGLVPVYVQLDPSRIVIKGEAHRPVMETRVAAGLRAQLQAQSFVTGLLQVALVHLPETPIRYRGNEPEIGEIPSAPAMAQLLMEQMKGMNFADMLVDTRETLSEIRQLALTAREDKLLENMNTLMQSLQQSTESLEKTVSALAADLKKTSLSTRETLGKGNQIIERADKMLAAVEKATPDLLSSTQVNADKLQQLQETLIETLKEAEGMLAQDSPLRYHLAELLHRYSKVAAKLEVLLDNLETRPESILTGKPE